MSDLLRRPRADEVYHITQLCLNSKRSLGYDEDFMAQCVDELTITAKKLREAEFWGMDREGILIGIGALKVNEALATCTIQSFFIDAHHRSSGIGKTLWLHLLERAKQLNLSRLTLTSEPLSVGFYERQGFVTVGREPSGSIAGRYLPLMELRLDGR